MKSLFDLSILDTMVFFVTAVIVLECVVLLRDPLHKSSLLRDGFILLAGTSALFECVAMLTTDFQYMATTLAMRCSFAFALGLMIAASVKRIHVTHERRSPSSQLGRIL
ncbi:MAG: hypothetical protein ING73_11235 [Rhodocyclaceae bacterium]|nr:hypothetical protein [Rhodocyclaceae bacterium]